MKKMMERKLITQKALDEAITYVTNKVGARLNQKGWGAYIGPHETYGILTEEFYELMLSLHGNQGANFYKELLDIAVGCIIGMASDLSDDTEVKGEIG